MNCGLHTLYYFFFNTLLLDIIAKCLNRKQLHNTQFTHFYTLTMVEVEIPLK